MTQAKKVTFSLRHLAMVTGLVLVTGALLVWWGKSVRDGAVNVDPALMQAMLTDAAQAEKSGRWSEAVGAYEKILEQAPNFAPGYLKLGMIYFHLGMPSKAQEQYLIALNKGISDPDIYLHLGYIKESQDDLDEAAAYYAKAELGGSQNPMLYFNMGNIHARKGRLDKALDYFKRAVLLNPGYMDAFVNLSIVSAQAEAYADSRYYLEKAEKLGYEAPAQFKKDLEQRLKK